MPKVSIVVPFHWMKNWEFHLMRCLMSIEAQTFTNYEIILTKAGSMPVNTNRAMAAAKGEIVKILYMDDMFAHADSLKRIVESFTPETHWLATGCLHEHSFDGNPKNYHSPFYNDTIEQGINTIGSPSVLAMRRASVLFFDEKLSWLLDCDLYKRLNENYGAPDLLDEPNVIIGIHDGQTSNLMSLKDKKKEEEYVRQKYE